MKLHTFFLVALFFALALSTPTNNNNHSPSSPFFVAADLVQVGLKSGMGADYIVGPAHAASWAPMETEAPPKPAAAPAPAPAASSGGGLEPGSSVMVLQNGAVVAPPGGVVTVPRQQVQLVPVQPPVPMVQTASVGAQPQSSGSVAGGAAGGTAATASSSTSRSSSVAPAMAYIMLDNYVNQAAGQAGTSATRAEEPLGFGAAAALASSSEEPMGFGAGVVPTAAALTAAAAPAAESFVAPEGAYAARMTSAYYDGPKKRAAATVPAQLQAAVPNAVAPVVVVAAGASSPPSLAPAPAPAAAPEAPKSKPKPLLRPSLGAHKQFKNETEEVEKEKKMKEGEKEKNKNRTISISTISTSSSRAPSKHNTTTTPASASLPDYSKHKFGKFDAKEALAFTLLLFSSGIMALFVALVVWKLVAVRGRKDGVGGEGEGQGVHQQKKKMEKGATTAQGGKRSEEAAAQDFVYEEMV